MNDNQKFNPRTMPSGQLEDRYLELDLCFGCAHEPVCCVRKAIGAAERDTGPLFVAVANCGQYLRDE